MLRIAFIAVLAIAPLALSATENGPVKFQSVWKGAGLGCSTTASTPKCTDDPADLSGCWYNVFKIDLEPFKQHCLYHAYRMNLTTCFQFGLPVIQQDARYFIDLVLWYNIFGFRRGDNVGDGYSTSGWAKGWIYNKDKPDGFPFAVAIAAGEHNSLNVNLPGKYLFKLETFSAAFTPYDIENTITPLQDAC